MRATTQAPARRKALMRAGRADEIVGAALYLASDASSFTTGAILRVDGLPNGSGARDPDHDRNLDYERDVVPLMGIERGRGKGRGGVLGVPAAGAQSEEGCPRAQHPPVPEQVQEP